jgi:hypothetical protein
MNLKCNDLLSTFDLNFDARHYSQVLYNGTVYDVIYPVAPTMAEAEQATKAANAMAEEMEALFYGVQFDYATMSVAAPTAGGAILVHSSRGLDTSLHNRLLLCLIEHFSLWFQ